MRLSSSARYHHVILVLTIVAQFVAPLTVFSLGALSPLVREALHLSREQIGLLTALFFTGAALISTPVGLLADRYGVRVFLIAVQGVGIPLLALPFLPTYHMLLLVMPLAGIAHGAVMPLTTKALYEWFPRERRATVIGIKLAALPIAGMVAGGMMPRLALWAGWSQPFAWVGGLMVASALSNLMLYRNQAQENPRKTTLTTTASWITLWRNANFIRLAIVGFLFFGVQYAFTAYLTLCLQEQWGMTLILAGSLLALAQGTAIIGRVLVGWVSDRWLQGERRTMLRGLGGGTLVALLALLLLPDSTPSFILAVVILLFGATILSFSGLYQTFAVELAGREAAGAGAGFASTLAQVGGIVTPPMFGRLADATGAYVVPWSILMLWMLLGVCLLGWVQTSFTVEEGVNMVKPELNAS